MDVTKNENGSHSLAFGEHEEPVEQPRWHAGVVATPVLGRQRQLHR